MPNPTSIRFTDAEHELIAVHQRRLLERTGREHSVTDVVRFLLREQRPSSGQSQTESAFRRAYKAVFG